ncbi:MAG TPA: hypothetical protein VFH15_03150 [Pyrinomonadaceae bacterium]|nr:hypothetical protein [Pyrinomonadaceae bacterium]
MSKHRIVVSAENNPYMEWQCKLFYFSCVTRLGQQPLIIVHDSGEDWCPGFYDLVKAGCTVYPAPNYRTGAHGDDYSGRNHPGSLIQAAQHLADQDEFIVLCDPDLIFTRSLEFPETLSGEFSSFMDYDSVHVSEALKELGLEKELVDLQKESLRCSVPYVIPIAQAQQLGVTWLQAIDAFHPRLWEDVMYAFGLALVRLGLTLNITHLTDTNYWPDEKVKAPIIHYAYGDDRWTKRNYHTVEQVAAIWETQPDTNEGTILDEILTQIRQAGEFYRDPFGLAPKGR